MDIEETPFCQNGNNNKDHDPFSDHFAAVKYGRTVSASSL
jgi:hypothetical protein